MWFHFSNFSFLPRIGTFFGLLLVWQTNLGADIPSGVKFKEIYDVNSFSFDQPTWIGGVPGDSEHLLVLERDGDIYHLKNEGSGYLKYLFFKVVPDQETHWDGAWAIDFHPNFSENRLFYLMYRKDRQVSVIEEWKVAEGSLDDPVKVRDIIFFNQNNVHASGDMKFGPDGYLYSSQGDKQWDAQDMTLLAGKIIRIDVDAPSEGKEYSIPSDNPYAGATDGTRKEIWATGVRVPWRFNFDVLNGDLLLGDVGGGPYEEVNLIKKGMNYGSSIMEGPCDSNCEGFTDPVLALTRTEAACIIGGPVYRNVETSEFYGVYLFGDWMTQMIYGLRYDTNTGELIEYAPVTDVGEMPGQIAAFGSDDKGRIFVSMYTEFGSEIDRAVHIYQLDHPQLLEKVPPVQVNKFEQSMSIAPNALTGPYFDLKGKRLTNSPDNIPKNRVLFIRDSKNGTLSKMISIQP